MRAVDQIPSKTLGLEATPDSQGLTLLPVYAKGELVVDNWWEAPEPERRSFWRRNRLFIAVFCVPVALACLYFGVIAAGQYVSEAQFLVRTSSQQGGGSNLASLVQNQKISRATDETFAVASYLVSREAVRELVENDALRDVLARPQADFLTRFPNFYSPDNFEALYRHFLKFVALKVDSESGIATLTVNAFSPEDSRRLADAMMLDAEKLINRLNMRLFDDTLKLAQKFVDEERAQLVDVERRLTDFRNAENVVDPGKESVAALQELGKLTSALMIAESGLSQEIAEAPQSPHIEPMKQKVEALRTQVAETRDRISGDKSSLASKLNDFDQLMIDRELAARGLGAAQARLVSARQDLEQQQFYLQTIVEPSVADQPLYPRRWLDIAFVAAIALCAFGVLRSVIDNVREHAA